MLKATGVGVTTVTDPVPPATTPDPTPVDPTPVPTPVPPAVSSTPLFLRKLFVDFVETALATILALNLVFPSSVTETKQMVVTIGIGLLAAGVAAIRRATPEFIAWLTTKMQVSQ